MDKLLLLAAKADLEALVWQQQTDCSSESINKDFEHMCKHLVSIYRKIDDLPESTISTFEQYILGDAINLISSIRFVDIT